MEEDWIGNLPNVVRVLRTLPVLETERSSIESVARELLESTSLESYYYIEPARLSKDDLRSVIQHCDEIIPLLDRMAAFGHIGTNIALSGGLRTKPPHWTGTDKQWADFQDSKADLVASELRVLREIVSAFPWPARVGRPSKWRERGVAMASLGAFRKLTGQEPDEATGDLVDFVESVFKAVGITTGAKSTTSAKSMTKRVLRKWKEVQRRRLEPPL